ncbi:MAG TPA: hypothetical protein DCX06_02825, partial [Opitutae bacterium]|nr:hypothetical protein [Opitutae bacterium]
LDAEARLAADGVVANQLELKFAGARLLEGSATVPLIFQLPIGGEPIWRLLDSGALLAQLEGVVTPDFSEWLHRSSGIQISDAALDLKVAGTIERPTGLLEMKVPSVVLAAAKVPVIEQIEIYAKAETDQLQLERFRFAVNQSEVSGSLSLPTAGLVKALTGSMGDYQSWLAQGTGQLELNNWRAEDWVDLLPPLLRRSGRFTGAVALKPEWDLSGRLVFEEFALRPTESAPLIDLIAGEVTLEKRKFTVVNASAQVGGSPVSIDGWFDVNDFGSPLWEFAVIGKNVPLVRTTDMILRSDLDVKASHTTRSETPLIRGVLNLRSSTMLVEFDPLTPDVNAGGRSKPPFFSISDPAFAEWRFDLKISGDTFMRVRSPYFKTQLSANFDLGGTFAEPLLVGSARTVAGELRFPGAKMPITSGEAYIERGRPNDVQLNFNGIAHKASYVITMDVSQTLADPQVQFQSTPALSNAAIVRLLTTGSTTGGGAGTVGLYLGQGLLGASGMDDQLADRLTVDVGEANSRSGRNTVDVRYDLSEDFSLEGAYDVYDAYNLDFSWSIFKR